MKSFIVLCTIAFAALFIVGHTPSLEAKHHNRFSFNIGTFFPGPAYVAAPVYPAYPAYVENRVYVDPYGYPMYEQMYVAPRPYRPVYVAPPVWTGFSFGARFR